MSGYFESNNSLTAAAVRVVTMGHRTAERVGTSSSAQAVWRGGLWAIAVAFIVPSLLFAVGWWSGWDGAFTTIVIADVSLLVFAVLATACAAWAAWVGRGMVRHSWSALAGGLAAWSVGQDRKSVV